MSNRLLVLLSGLLLLSALASYVYYRRVVARTPVDPWTLVPEDAAVVIATRDHATLVRRLKETQLWDNLATLSYFQQVEEQVVLADSLGASRGTVLGFLGRKIVLTSLHGTGPRSFDLLFQVPVASVWEHRQIRTLVEALGRDARYRVSTRDYHGQQLITVTQRRSGGGLTYMNYRNTLVISANPALVEAVVLRTEYPRQPSIAAEFGNTDYLQLKDVDAALLINYRQLPPFLSVFFRPELRPDFEYLASIGSKSLLEMKLTSNRVLFNGFTNAEPAAGSLHQRLRTQAAGRLRMAEVLSTRTAALIHLYAAPATLRPAAPLDTLARPLVDSLAATLDTEAALCYLATPSPRVAPGRLALVRTRSAARAAQWLGQLRRRTGTSPSFERFGPYQLYQHGVPRLAERLLGPLFAPVGTAAGGATALVGDYLVVADDVAALRTYLTDIAAGQNWTRTPSQMALLEETTPVAQLSVVLDTRNSWNVLLRSLVEERRAGLLRNEALFQRFPQVALQYAPVDSGQYYTQLVLRHPPVGPAVAGAQQAGGVGSSLNFQRGLASLGPTLLPAAGGRPAPVLVQDRRRTLHYVTPDNTVAWSDSLNGPLVAPPALLPGAFGARPGVLLLTANRVYLLNERGRSARNFPLNLPDTVRAASLSSAPPADGQPARLLVADRYANVYLFDARGDAPAGWQPKRLDFALAAPPQLLRVGGRDVVVCLLENGYIYAYDALGNTLPGFPISLGARLHTSAFVETGPTLRRTRLSVVNQHGELVTFTLSGEISQRRRLTTWSRNSTFRLVADAAGQGYVVVRDDGQGQLTVLDATGRALVDRRFLTSAEKPVQLFDFGPGRRVLAISETGPGKAYLYDARNRLIGGQPFDSSAPTVGLSYDATTNTYQLYRQVGTELRRLTLKMN